MKKERDWACQECGKKMTLKQAESAVRNGCPKCGGYDIDLNVVEPPRFRTVQESSEVWFGTE